MQILIAMAVFPLGCAQAPSPQPPAPVVTATPQETEMRGVVEDGYGLDGMVLREFAVQITMDPAPDAPGGNVFLTGFRDVHPRFQMPMPGTSPQDHHALGMFVQKWPLTSKVELYEGLHYFVIYGFQEWPGPGDRMSEFTKITESLNGPLEFQIGTITIPKDSTGGFR